MVRDCSGDNLTLLTNEVHAFASRLLISGLCPAAISRRGRNGVNLDEGGEKALFDDNM